MHTHKQVFCRLSCVVFLRGECAASTLKKAVEMGRDVEMVLLVKQTCKWKGGNDFWFSGFLGPRAILLKLITLSPQRG